MSRLFFRVRMQSPPADRQSLCEIGFCPLSCASGAPMIAFEPREHPIGNLHDRHCHCIFRRSFIKSSAEVQVKSNAAIYMCT
jgi:hypothetical protein